ncbi:MAG: hypothetical protein ACJA0Z_004387 [Halioglobus sp.]|jgi:hypothetical protein
MAHQPEITDQVLVAVQKSYPTRLGQSVHLES